MSKPAGVTSVVVGPADGAHRRDVAGRSGGEDVDRRVVADEGLVVRVDLNLVDGTERRRGSGDRAVTRPFLWLETLVAQMLSELSS